MNERSWRDLLIGLSVIVASAFLWFNALYTVEIGVFIGVMALWWLLT